MTESVFINKDYWKTIDREYFFQAAMYYLSDTEQPLRFLNLVDEQEGLFSIEKRNGNFKPIVIDGST